ncbi:arylesterase [Noviherbaspirillum sp. Root189]|uniref:arylesterase n=1 Tax=Noviherbaspirillum sp. Root189 TaxID=1736487 RepID=UPI000B1E0330|nr:arylesterase [Noviherbaspirillum sp. Root189]
MQNNWKKHGMKAASMRWLAALSLVLFATCAHSASKTVLVLGDSLSAEYGLARGSGWVTLLEQRIRQSKLNVNVVNASISGETTSGGKARLPALLTQHRPDVVLIELGANDGLRGLPVASAERNLSDMIKASKATNAQVLLIGMQIPPNYGREYTQRFTGMYEKLAKETKVGLAPFLLQSVADDPTLFQSDRIHPVAEAQPIMLDNVWPYLKPLLSK